MENQFKEIMSNKTTKELLKILEMKGEYQPEAIVTVQEELDFRKKTGTLDKLQDDTIDDFVFPNDVTKLSNEELIEIYRFNFSELSKKEVEIITKEIEKRDLEQKIWYYAVNGKKSGPVSNFVIERMVEEGKLSLNSMVWKKTFSEWKTIADTELADELYTDDPPPLTGDVVKNSAAWAISFSPLFGGFFALFALIIYGFWGQIIFWFILNTILVSIDHHMLKRAGYRNKDLMLGIFLVPVYLWRRSNMTKQSQVFFWIWLISFLISLSF